jgi:vitamin B12 transporter
MRRMLMATVLLPAALICLSRAAHAQAATNQAQDTAILPDVVVTATRVPTLISQIPAGVTVIDRAQIDAYGYTTLPQALASVPGLHVVQSGGPGGNASVFIRGTNSDHVLVLRDGLPINDPSDPGDAFNFGVDTLDDIERIEIVRGPMSSLYGTGAIGGVINLISRKGEGKPHAHIELAYGLPRAVLANGGFSGVTGKFDYDLEVGTRDDRGFDSTPKRESVYTGAPNGYQEDLGSVSLGYTPVDGTRISAYVRGRTALFHLDELGDPAYDANDYRARDDSLYGRIGVDSKLFGGVWETSLFLGHAATDRHYIEPLEAADPNQAFGDSRYHGRRTDLQWNNTVHLPPLGPTADSALIVGYEHIDDTAHSVLDTATDGFPYQSDLHAGDSSDAGHVGLQTTVLKRLTLTGDTREEGATYGGNAFTWRFGGVLAVPEIWSRFKASYGTSFRAPSLYDLFGVDSYGYVGNPDLRPERSRGYELGWAVDVPAFGVPNAATIDVTYFNNRIHDLIETVYNADYTASTQENVDQARIQGIETSLTIRPAHWLDAVLSYTWTDARDAADNSRLLRRPIDQASLSLHATPLPGLSIAPQILYEGAFQDYLVDDNGFPLGVGRAKSGVIANLTISYAITPRLTLFADGRNLGGSRYEPASGYQTPGPSGLFGVRARF